MQTFLGGVGHAFLLDEPKERMRGRLLVTRPEYLQLSHYPGGGAVLPYIGYIGMCRCEGYGFQAVYSRIGYINQNIWV